MSTQRFDAFDRAEHTARTWVAAVAESLDSEDMRFAYRVLRAWLHAVRDRLPADAATHLAAGLPELLRGVFFDGWVPSRVPVKFDAEELIRRISAEARIEAREAPAAAARVTAALGNLCSPGQLAHVIDLLPEPLRGVLLSGDRTHVPASAPAPPHRATAGGIDEQMDRMREDIKALSEGLRALLDGLEEIPSAEPLPERGVRAARRAHQILLSHGAPS